MNGLNEPDATEAQLASNNATSATSYATEALIPLAFALAPAPSTAEAT